MATGGTVNCVANMIESYNKEVVGILVVVELLKLKGKLKIKFPVESSITFWNLIKLRIFMYSKIVRLFRRAPFFIF